MTCKACEKNYTPLEISFAGGKNIRTQGRAEITDEGVVLMFSGDCVEFLLECAGTMTLEYSAAVDGRVQLVMDGRLVGTRPITAASGTQCVLAEDIAPGHHMFRIVQEDNVSMDGHVTLLTGIRVSGRADSLQPTGARKLYVEFVGDSITCGTGTLPDAGDDPVDYNSATHGYAYLCADELDADYALIARGGLRLANAPGEEPVPVCGEDIYLYQNVYRNRTDMAEYGKADVIVVGLGTNGARENPIFREQLSHLLSVLREKNPRAKLVVIYNMMNDKHAAVFAEMADEAAGIYVFRMQRSRDGVGNHPTAEASAQNGRALAAYIRSIL